MTTQDDLRAVAGKALANPEFRQKLLDDPVAAVKEVGFELSEEDLKALREMDKEKLEQGLGELDERLTMACWAHTLGTVSGPSAATPINIPTCGWH